MEKQFVAISFKLLDLRVIAGATWEFTDNWDCGDNDIESRPAIAWGVEGSVEARISCASRCLNLPDCVSFNYPIILQHPFRCYLKHTNRKSRTNGRQWNCGSPHGLFQYYTLIDKKARWLGQCGIKRSRHFQKIRALLLFIS